ncbi:Macrolide export ATP-binding/permease protein MacB [hydrothermal vent metagenome]|uniref:Macrolide export ATP-binding/permease protein MacB n=1 Tax=hydrothermal vent metagenome TaxID=652676 RepID=A0A3B0T175_9ZZZZ
MLELRNVSKKYASGAVGAVSSTLKAERGEFVALFGPSGSGKTSLLQMAGLLIPPDSGEVWIDGERRDDASETRAARVRRSKLGFIFQTSGLLPLLSAHENVDVSLRLLGVGRGTRTGAVEFALDRVGMRNRANHRPEELSGGEQQRVSIARALVHEPAYLLADEPTGELDTATGAAILSLLRDVAHNDTAVIMASHDPAAIEFVDRALYVNDGHLSNPPKSALVRWLTDGTPINAVS